MILNLLTLICCIPIITAGDAMTALYYMTVKMVKNEECYIVKGYFKSFKENFKQATIIWLIALLVGIILVDFFLKALSHTGMLAKFQQSLGAKVYDRKSDKSQTTDQSSPTADSLHH